MICLQITWISFLIASFWLWKEAVIPGQLLLQCLCTLLVVMLGLTWLIRLSRTPSANVMSLTADGEVNWLQGTEQGCWKLSHKSKICGVFICLFFQKNIFDNRSRFIWLAKDQVSEQDFRRLCRVVLRCQQQSLGCETR
ncbi:protein YgfX [Aliiglaciecola aliphaticivorans]